MNFQAIIKRYEAPMLELLNCVPRPFNETLNQHLPRKGGIYRVFEVIDEPHHYTTIYIGRTNDLQHRIYDDLYLGKASTPLRDILARTPDIKDVKTYLEEHCRVQVAVVSDLEERTYLKWFACAVLRPTHNL